jgi:hypothetical protein
VIPRDWRGTNVAMRPAMRFVVYVASPLCLSVAFWCAFVACIDTPIPDPPPVARVVTTWDPLSCGDPHRVAIELADEEEAMVSASTPCSLGVLAVDVPRFGVYTGRIYAWILDGEPAIRAITPVTLNVDDTVVRWIVQTPR